MAKPVVVVGNITVGGVGKTPLVIYLVKRLKNRGVKPAVVLRGYGRKEKLKVPALVTDDSRAAAVGDEALLIYSRTGVPVYVHEDRVAAARIACADGVDVVICDDGLQHYRLQRDIELAVMDGSRKLGNGCLIPAGPLREPASRLHTVDQVVYHHTDCHKQKSCMYLELTAVINLSDGRTKDLVAWRGERVHAIAAIGNPERFYRTLSTAGLAVVTHSFPDHHSFSADDFKLLSPLPIIMTEKDAVKCRGLELKNAWFVRVETKVSADLEYNLDQHLDRILST